MNIMHKGFVINGLTGGFTAEINEVSGHYVEITVTGGGRNRSFDLEGLEAHAREMDQICQMARQVEAINLKSRGAFE